MDGGPRIRVELGDADFFDLHHSAFFNSLPVVRDGLLKEGAAACEYTLRFVRVPELTAEPAWHRYEPLGNRMVATTPAATRRPPPSMRTDSSPLPGLSRMRRVRQLIMACHNGGTTRQQHWRCPYSQVLRRPGQPELVTWVTGGCRRRGAPAAAREGAQFPDAGLECAAGLPGPIHQPGPVTPYSRSDHPFGRGTSSRTRQQDHRTITADARGGRRGQRIWMLAGGSWVVVFALVMPGGGVSPGRPGWPGGRAPRPRCGGGSARRSAG
jgi:Putative glycolipid-binding